MKKPFFSVVIPTFNQAHLLGEALDSVIAQTCTDWEVVVVNDGSTDNTAEVIEKYAEQDKRIKCFHKENGGTASALNYGIVKAEGEWVTWLSSDDMFVEDKLEIMDAAIKKNPEIKFFYSHYYYLNDETKEKTTPDLWQQIPSRAFQVTKFLVGNYVHAISLAIHSSVFQNVGYFNETQRQAQDFDMWLRISSKFETMYVDKRTCVTRFHPGQDTNAFPEGMYYDSARSCLDFINQHKYEEFYPLLDFKKENHIKLALEDSISIVIEKNAFMYRCGYIPAFIDRLNEWIHTKLPKTYHKGIKDSIRALIEKEKNNIPNELLDSLLQLCNNTSFAYKSYDFFEETIKHIDKLIEEGNQDLASKLDRYLHILFTKRETQKLNFVIKEGKYIPRLNFENSSESYLVLPYNKLKYWELIPLTYEGKFKFILEAECPVCSNKIKLTSHIQVKTEKQEISFVCCNCKSGFKVFDDEIGKYLQATAYNDKAGSSTKNKIAFISRGLIGKSGGTIIFTKYMQWLKEIGCDITIYCDTEKGDWTDFPGKFVKVDNYRDVELREYDYVFLYTILDLGKIISKINPERIIYVCQAYEGFLYGDNFDLLRTDKPMFHSLHTIPFKTIAVSKHLQNLFREYFSKEAYLVTNFVDTEHFKPLKDINKDNNTILFVGNPIQPLKGLNVLLSSIKLIQNSASKIEKLKLVVTVGIATNEMKERLKKLQSIIGCEIHFFAGLTAQQMSEVINSSSVYVCNSWYEGFSLSVLEAMACGTPVITTKNMGAESFCKNDYNSYVLDYGDYNKLAVMLVAILNNNYNKEIIKNAFITAKAHSESNSRNLFSQFVDDLGLDNIKSVKIHEDITEQLIPPTMENLIMNKNNHAKMKLRITYLVTNLNSLTGGNLTILSQANELLKRGHKVYIVTFTKAPEWFKLNAEVITIPDSEDMYKYVPDSDIVIATYFQNAIELENINAPVKVYFAQGDQFIFGDEVIESNLTKNTFLKELKEISSKSYSLKNIKLLVNSEAFAKLVFEKTNRAHDGIVRIGVDRSIFRPLDRQLKGFNTRILLVGPDILGPDYEPLHFKGITEAKKALDRIKKEYNNVTVVRISNTGPYIFQNYNCEFYLNPTNELKTFLFGTADILIYPSYYESWGLPPLEAMASNTAVICTDNIGSRDYAVDNVNCLVVEPKSSTSIYNAVKRLLKDDKLKEKIISGGSLTALKYSKENEWNNLEKLLLEFYANSQSVSDQQNASADINESNEQVLMETKMKTMFELIEQKNYSSAITVIENILDSFNDGITGNVKLSYSDLLNIAGNTYLAANDIEKAREYFEMELNTNASSSSACLGLGNIFLAKENYEAAKTMFEWAVKNDPSNNNAVSFLGKVNLLLGIEENHNSLLIED